MKRYDKYKDSGVDWIGEIPVHWEMLSNKYIFKFKKSQVGKKSADFELLSLTLKGIIKRDMENPEGKFPAEFDTYQKVKKGDFVFCLFDVEETPRTVGLSDFNGMITGAYTVFTGSPKTDSKYLFYFYLNLDEKKRLKFLYRGLRNTIPKDSFFSFKTTFPPLPEQQAIASFLDDKTAKIDQTISIKEKEIELLKERRQILIQKAVTKGLDDKVKLKDSGVEWIGAIPKHWEVRKLKYLSNVVLGKMICSEDKGNYKLKPYLKSKNIQWMELNLESVDEMWFSEKELLQYKLQEGDIIVSEGGEVGKATLWNNELPECYIQNSAHKVTFSDRNNNKFYLRCFFNYGKLGVFDSVVNKVSIGHLTREKLVNIYFPNPPLEEQTQIVSYLEKIEEKISKAISLKQQEIEKLKEYKTVLIDDVVTGKVKIN